GVIPQARGLAKRQELCKPNLIDLVPQIPSRLCQGGRSAPNQICWPFEIIGVVMRGLQCSEQCVVFEPMSMDVAELLIGCQQVSARPSPEGGPCGLEKTVLEWDDGAVIDRARREGPDRAVARPQLFACEPALSRPAR